MKDLNSTHDKNISQILNTEGKKKTDNMPTEDDSRKPDHLFAFKLIFLPWLKVIVVSGYGHYQEKVHKDERNRPATLRKS